MKKPTNRTGNHTGNHTGRAKTSEILGREWGDPFPFGVANRHTTAQGTTYYVERAGRAGSQEHRAS